MKRAGLLLLGVVIGACSTSPDTSPDDLPVLNETTLTRQDGTRISIEELRSLRPSAIATADTIARIDRMLLEPWAETRDATILIEHLRSRHPSDTRLAETLWETLEPPARGKGRDLFREYGVFANQLLANGFGPRARPASLPGYVEGVLANHTDADSKSLLQAAWRRFAPLVRERKAGYLASYWQLELDYVSSVNVALCDSLLGPFERALVLGGDEHSFFGPIDSYEGYTGSAVLLDLLTPGPQSPVEMCVEQLLDLAGGARSSVGFGVTDGAVERAEDVDLEFFVAALSRLKDGWAEIDSLPRSVRTIGVVFSYLVDGAEARASLSFNRIPQGWELRMFEYEPAAANFVGGNARLDLMPTIRTLLERNRRG
ncbi:MAG: hypothetical protein K8I27_14035 [Planctomycetes bacterium]|nr:hypothetical protein [Planctomycetota bacterium]